MVLCAVVVFCALHSSYIRKERIRYEKRIAVLMALMMTAALAGCGSKDEGEAAGGSSAGADSSSTTSQSQTEGEESGSGSSGVEDGVLTSAMECAYAPYNWTQTDDSNGAVPIKDSNEYANGYDVMMAKKICEANGWELEVVRTDWDSLVPGVQSGTYDAVIAGQSHDRGSYGRSRFRRPLLLRFHRLRYQEGQPLRFRPGASVICPAAPVPPRLLPSGTIPCCLRSRTPRSRLPLSPRRPCSWLWKPIP